MQANGLRKEAYAAMLLLLLTLGLGACETELDLPVVSRQNKIVLLGEFIAGDTMHLRAGQSTSISSSVSTPDIITGLLLQVTEPSGNILTLHGEPDFDTSYLRTVPFSAANMIQPGKTYHLKGVHHTLAPVDCRIDVPDAFTASIADTVRTSFSGKNVMEIKLVLQDNPGADHYYVVEVVKESMMVSGSFLLDGNWYDIFFNKDVYDSLKQQGPVVTDFDTLLTNQFERIPSHTNDANTENLKYSSAANGFRRILIDDRTFSGGSYTLSVFAETDNFDSEFNKGRIVVWVKSVDKEYYDYLKVYERSTNELILNISGVPLKLQGNVTNGLGVVGGVYRNSFPVYYEDFGL